MRCAGGSATEYAQNYGGERRRECFYSKVCRNWDKSRRLFENDIFMFLLMINYTKRTTDQVSDCSSQ